MDEAFKEKPTKVRYDNAATHIHHLEDFLNPNALKQLAPEFDMAHYSTLKNSRLKIEYVKKTVPMKFMRLYMRIIAENLTVKYLPPGQRMINIMGIVGSNKKPAAIRFAPQEGGGYTISFLGAELR